jgi:hypothetical protein
VNSTTYRVLCSYAGLSLSSCHPWPVPAVVPFPVRAAAAVYVVDDETGRCCYVGSVRRGPGGLADRLADHLGDPTKRARWHTVWVMPLRPETPVAEVRRIEGVVGAHLGPYLSSRLPVPRPSIAFTGRYPMNADRA